MDNESETIKRMIEIYCADKHAGADGLCDDCKSLLDYAVQKIGKCPQKPKPKCSKCKIHCFSSEMRTRIREVMRYSGPRMLIRHPLMALRHCLK
ncbi:MAG: nitrous oxide-stimulated promoter family protein [Victivallales bacterium]|jgi:hypothetical protein